MKTWTATTTVDAAPGAVLDLLCDPEACTRWAPVPFAIDDDRRLHAGHRTTVRGQLAGIRAAFAVEVLAAGADGLALRADGPVAFDVRYDLAPADAGSEVRASVGLHGGRGLTGRVLANGVAALLGAGALQAALGRIATEAALV